jgi:hypothetical protein
MAFPGVAAFEVGYVGRERSAGRWPIKAWRVATGQRTSPLSNAETASSRPEPHIVHVAVARLRVLSRLMIRQLPERSIAGAGREVLSSILGHPFG